MSTVIKASGTNRAAEAGAFSFQDLNVKAETYLEQVRGQAAQILAQAQKDAMAVRQRAEEEGKRAAMTKVEALLDERIGKQMVTLMPALKQAVDKIVESRNQWLSHAEKSTVRLATAIAERVIRRELTRQPEITLDLVREGLEMAAGSAEVQVRLNPQDHAALAGQTRALAAELSRLGTPDIVADPAIEVGGCRIDTRFGSIDQQFQAQLARIEQELT